MTMDIDHVAILLEIKKDIGALDARVTSATEIATESRARLEASLTTALADIKPRVDDLEKSTEDLIQFKARVGAYLWLAGSVISGALFLVWQGISFFGDAIRRWLH